MVIQESIDPVTEFPYFQASKNPLIQCLLCECSTLEESLKAHIQYNHMIYKDQILKVGFFFSNQKQDHEIFCVRFFMIFTTPP